MVQVNLPILQVTSLTPVYSHTLKAISLI